MHITLVKKIKQDGQLCAKSAKVVRELKEFGLSDRIDRVVIADERNPSESEGYALAAEHQVEAAPFFIVTNEDSSTRVYTAYQHFLKEVFNRETSESEVIAEMMAQNPELDFI